MLILFSWPTIRQYLLFNSLFGGNNYFLSLLLHLPSINFLMSIVKNSHRRQSDIEKEKAGIV